MWRCRNVGVWRGREAERREREIEIERKEGCEDVKM